MKSDTCEIEIGKISMNALLDPRVLDAFIELSRNET